MQPARVFANRLRDRRREGKDVMAGLCFDLVDAFDREGGALLQ